MTTESNQMELARLCMPFASTRSEEIKKSNAKFAHYTSAYVAMQIIANEEIWMRNAQVMNDFMEVQHGQNCLAESWHDQEIGARLKRLLESLETGLWQKVADGFDKYVNERELQSFLISVSEHGSEETNEEKYGRLSMWRAYGGDTNVAIVFNNKAFTSETSTLNAWASPVLYRDSEGFKLNFGEMVIGLEKNTEFLKSFDPDEIVRNLNWAFHFASLSTKHPGFAEEKEWRIIHSPSMFPSEDIKYSIEVIGDVPQKIYKLPFGNFTVDGVDKIGLSVILEEIIIGPTENPWPIYEALALKLEEKGISDAWAKVKISDIPLRR